jgi:hypothetical protein
LGDELAVGEAQQKLLVHVLAKQKGPFLRARGAEMEDLTTEGAEVLEPTAGIGALDPGDALGVVPAFQEAAHRLGDPLQAELRYNPMLWIGKKRAYPSMLAKARKGVRSNGEDTG